MAEIAVMKAYVKYRDRICFERYKVPFTEMKDATIREELDRKRRN